jgi:hypothetical protein
MTISLAADVVTEPTLLSFAVTGLMAASTGGFGWLTWRWARGLPPTAALATPRELEELGDEGVVAAAAAESTSRWRRFTASKGFDVLMFGFLVWSLYALATQGEAPRHWYANLSWYFAWWMPFGFAQVLWGRNGTRLLRWWGGSRTRAPSQSPRAEPRRQSRPALPAPADMERGVITPLQRLEERASASSVVERPGVWDEST